MPSPDTQIHRKPPLKDAKADVRDFGYACRKALWRPFDIHVQLQRQRPTLYRCHYLLDFDVSKFDPPTEAALDLLSKCLMDLYGLTDGGLHEESDLLLAATRLRKIIEAVAPADRQRSYDEAIDDALTTTPEDRQLEAALSSALPGPFLSSRAKRVAHVAEGLRDDVTLGRLSRRGNSTGDAAKRSDLNPWPVVRSFLLGLSSFKVPDLVDRSGLSVNWALTDKENYSEKSRLAAYRPLIDAAYQALSSDDDRLRVTYIVTQELAKRGSTEELNSALRKIGWELRDDKLVPSGGAVRELFFPRHSQHDAYVEIRTILQNAVNRIEIVDPYIDQSILTLISTCTRTGMNIRILTSRLPTDFALEAGKWLSQHTTVSLEVRTTKEFHDRFIVLDDAGCWHVGCSIKDAGNKAFMLSELEDHDNRKALLSQVAKSWSTATIVL